MGHGHEEQHDPGNDAADHPDEGADLDPVAELDRVIAVFFQKARRHDVGGGADYGDVAAVAGTEEKGPPENGIVG